MTSVRNEQQCLVCGDIADSLHFGALSCRACAAFFRRKVARRRIINRRCNQNCSIMSNNRKLCASCRYEACVKAGMKETAVLSRFTTHSDAKGEESSPSPSCEPHHVPTTSTNLRFLEKLKIGYCRLEMLRSEAFQLSVGFSFLVLRGGGKQTDFQTIPTIVNFQAMNEILKIDIKLIIQSIIEMFDEVANLEKSQQKILISHFVSPFILLESGCKSLNSDLVPLPSGDFIDLNKTFEYYTNNNNQKGKVAYEVFHPYWRMHKQNMKLQLDDINLDHSEFLFLSALFFWDFGIQGQTDECIAVCHRIRANVIRELSEYEKNVRMEQDPSYRVGCIVMMLQHVQRTLSLLEETMEISLIYDIYELHNSFFDALRGN